jgi:hypothetical protein
MQKIVSFAYQEPKTSSRTADVIKSVEVLSIQFVCLLKLKEIKCEKEELLQHFYQEKLQELKKAFVRYAVEEVLRRQVNPGDSFSGSDAKVKSVLMKDHEAWLNKIWSRRKNQIENQQFDKKN